MKFNLFLLGFCMLIAVIEPGSSAPAGGGNDEEKNEASDYDYTGDEEVPAEQKKLDDAKNKPMPYFNKKLENLFVKKGQNVSLDCPAMNYDVSNTFLWYKEKTLISNGLVPTVEGYSVEKNLTLNIPNFSIEHSGNYYCVIIPQNVTKQIIVKIGDPISIEPATSAPDQMAKPANLENEPSKASRELGLSMILIFILFALWPKVQA